MRSNYGWYKWKHQKEKNVVRFEQSLTAGAVFARASFLLFGQTLSFGWMPVPSEGLSVGSLSPSSLLLLARFRTLGIATDDPGASTTTSSHKHQSAQVLRELAGILWF
jgi:hypothetical protein